MLSKKSFYPLKNKAQINQQIREMIIAPPVLNKAGSNDNAPKKVPCICSSARIGTAQANEIMVIINGANHQPIVTVNENVIIEPVVLDLDNDYY